MQPASLQILPPYFAGNLPFVLVQNEIAKRLHGELQPPLTQLVLF